MYLVSETKCFGVERGQEGSLASPLVVVTETVGDFRHEKHAF